MIDHICVAGAILVCLLALAPYCSNSNIAELMNSYLFYAFPFTHYVV